MQLQNVCVSDRRHQVLKDLADHHPRFKCGREYRKRSSLWALRSRVPPPVPIIKLPQNEALTEASITRVTFKIKKGYLFRIFLSQESIFNNLFLQVKSRVAS